MKSPSRTAIVLMLGVAMAIASGLLAQSGLPQLGLTETAARNFVMSEIRSQVTNRRSDIVQTGRRAFFRLPRNARGPAATALFAWAKTYANSATFRTAYAGMRRDVVGSGPRPSQPTVEQELQKEIEAMKGGMAQLRQAAATMSPADREKMLKVIEQQEAQIQSGELAKMLRTGMEAERAERAARDATSAAKNDEQYPADPEKIFARKLRQFLDDTATVNFSARTLSLAGGADGIEFIDKADRAKPWMWQEAVIVGPEATAAARAAAEAWLKEVER